MDQFAKSLIEKVFLGAIAAVVSAFVLHSYNLHLKAFEGAQTQLRSISTISIKSKDDIILAVGEIRTIANSLPLKLSVKVRPSEEIVRQIVNIRSASAVLESRLPAAAAVARSIETNMFKEIYKKYSKATSSFQITEPELKKVDDNIVADELRFLNTFDKELASLLANEYEKAYSTYYGSVSRYAQPLYLVSLALGFSLILIIAFMISPGVVSLCQWALRALRRVFSSAAAKPASST